MPGPVQVCGRPVRRGDRAARCLVGAVAEVQHLYGDMSCAEYLRFFAALYRHRRSRARGSPRCSIWSGSAIGPRDRAIDLSKGLQQKLGLARALLHDPPVLVLDEPVSGLDPHGIREVREIICRERDRGRLVFLSSHVLSEIERTADRIGIMRQGRLVFEGTIEDVHGAPRDAGGSLPVDHRRGRERRGAGSLSSPRGARPLAGRRRDRVAGGEGGDARHGLLHRADARAGRGHLDAAGRPAGARRPPASWCWPTRSGRRSPSRCWCWRCSLRYPPRCRSARDRESGTLEVLFYGPVDEITYVLGKAGGLLARLPRRPAAAARLARPARLDERLRADPGDPGEPPALDRAGGGDRRLRHPARGRHRPRPLGRAAAGRHHRPAARRRARLRAWCCWCRSRIRRARCCRCATRSRRSTPACQVDLAVRLARAGGRRGDDRRLADRAAQPCGRARPAPPS